MTQNSDERDRLVKDFATGLADKVNKEIADLIDLYGDMIPISVKLQITSVVLSSMSGEIKRALRDEYGVDLEKENEALAGDYFAETYRALMALSEKVQADHIARREPISDELEAALNTLKNIKNNVKKKG